MKRVRQPARSLPARPRAGASIRSSRLWPTSLREDLRRALIEEGVHKVGEWSARYTVGIADWPAVPVDPFFNVNTPEEVAEAERLAARYPEA